MSEYRCDACGFESAQRTERCPRCDTPFEHPQTGAIERDSEAADRQPLQQAVIEIPAATAPNHAPPPGPFTPNEYQDAGAAFGRGEPAPQAGPGAMPTEFDGIEEREIDATPVSVGLISLLISPFGRIGRMDYVTGVLLIGSLYATSLLAGICAIPLGADENAATQVGTVVMVLSLAAVFPLLIKRLHDQDLSGWGVLTVFLCGAFVVLIAAPQGGSRHANQYGPPTRLRWNPLRLVLVVTLLIIGCYSAVMLAAGIELEERYQSAWSDVQEHPESAVSHDFESIYERAVWIRKYSPLRDDATVIELYSAWIYGEALYKQEKWESSVQWLERAVHAGELLSRARTTPEFGSTFTADLVNLRIGYADALEAAGDQDRAAAVREAIVEKLDQAAGDLNESLELNSRAMVLLEQEKHDEAQVVLTDLIQIDEARLAARSYDHELRTSLGGTYHNRALARLNLGDVNGAQADIHKAIGLQEVAFTARTRPDQCREYYGLHLELLGDLCAERRDANAALENYEKACEVNPASLSHHVRAAMIRHERLEFDKLVDLLSPFLRHTEDIYLEYLLAVSQLYEKDEREADRTIDRLVSRHPDSVEGHFLQGVIKMVRGDHQEALPYLGRAYSQRAGDRAILFNLAICHARTGQQPEAQRAIAELFYVDSAQAERVRRYVQDGNTEEIVQPMLELSYD